MNKKAHREQLQQAEGQKRVERGRERKVDESVGEEVASSIAEKANDVSVFLGSILHWCLLFSSLFSNKR